FRIQVGVVYLYAGLAKAQGDWLLHGQPLRIWLGDNTKLPLLGRLFLLDEVPLVMSWAGFLFDTTIVGWLLWRRSRRWASAVPTRCRALAQALYIIGRLPSIMVCWALVFGSPSWPRRALAALRSAGRAKRCHEATPPPSAAPAASPPHPTSWQKL